MCWSPRQTDGPWEWLPLAAPKIKVTPLGDPVLTQLLQRLSDQTSRPPGASQPRQRGRKRIQVAAALLGLGLITSMPAAQAATNVVFVSGAFMRSISVADLESLAQTGQARGLLADVLTLSKQKPATIAKLLNQQLTLPIVLTSRLLNTRIGEAILTRVAQLVFPLKAKPYGVPALRAAVILGLDQGKGSLSPIGFIKAYPTSEMEVSIPAMMSIFSKASSLADLVNFFSNAPLDGLKGETSSSK
jgi:hypothetical protein